MNRTDESRTIAVVRTRLPYTDRRSLSQAWFSALHLSDGPSAPPAIRSGGTRASALARPIVERTGPRSQAGTCDASPACAGSWSRPPARGAARPPIGGDGACAPMRAARAASPEVPAPERARTHPPLRTVLTLGVAGERVALLLRREGATLHVVAVCRPAVENAVRHALTLAAAHVRGGGDSLRASVRALGRTQP